MRNRFYLTAAILLLSLSGGVNLHAADGDAVAFDIYECDGVMTVWIDMASVITSRRVDLMKEGVDHAIEFRVELFRPKRLWGSDKISEAAGVFRIGYQVITEDYFLLDVSRDSESERSFSSLARLHQFLVDSVALELAVLDSLDSGRDYFIEIAMTCVSLAGINLAEVKQSDTDGESPIRWLFRGFLDLTNFGREDYKVKSRPFSLSEISPRD